MKVLFTADIHLKLGQKNVPIAWARNRYDKLFRSICNLCAEQKIGLLVLGGDIFDKTPSMEELELYFDFLFRIRCETIIYSGNHEAVKKNTTFLTNLKEISYQISCATPGSSRINIIDDFYSLENMDFIPYNKLKEYRPADIDFHGDILFTHCRGFIPPYVKPEVPLELFDRWKVVLAGDLHSYENSQRNILYPGSPITVSFHRNRVDTGVIVIDTETLEHEWVKLDLPQLIRKTIKAGEPMLATEYDHTIYEVEGDISELSELDSNELLDKKITKRNNDVSLYLEAGMSLRQEIKEYLTYVTQLEEDKVLEVMEEFDKHRARIDDNS